MKKLFKKKWFIPAVVGAILLIAAIIVLIVLNSNKSYRVIKLEDYEGDVVINRGNQLLELFAGLQLTSGDSSTTGEESLMHLLIDSDKHMLVTPNTVFKIKATGTEEKGKVRIDLEEGKAYFEVDNKLNDSSSFDVVTPNATTSIRGTKFLTVYEPDVNTTHVFCSNGKVEVSYGKNQVIDVNPGEAVSIVDDTAVKEHEVGLDFGYLYDFTSPDFRNQINYNVFYIDEDHKHIYIENAPSSVKSIMSKHSDEIYEFYEDNRAELEDNIKTQDRPNLIFKDVTSWFPNEISLDYGEGTKKFRVELCNLTLIYDELSGFPEGVNPQDNYYGNVIEKNGKYYMVSGVTVYLSMTPKDAEPKKTSAKKNKNNVSYHLTKNTVYDGDGNLISWSNGYEYDDKGNAIMEYGQCMFDESIYYYSKDGVLTDYSVEYKYDESGNMIYRRWIHETYPQAPLIIDYDEKGRKVKTYNGTKDNPALYWLHEYDETENSCTTTQYQLNDNGTYSQTGQVRIDILDENGNTIKEISRNRRSLNDPNDIYESIYTYELEYDEYNNLLKRSRYYKGQLLEVNEYEYEEFTLE